VEQIRVDGLSGGIVGRGLQKGMFLHGGLVGESVLGERFGIEWK
jgi:hypothetical protein